MGWVERKLLEDVTPAAEAAEHVAAFALQGLGCPAMTEPKRGA